MSTYRSGGQVATGLSSDVRSIENVVGQSASIQSVRRALESVANNHSTVLLVGESGTGKELFAQTLHGISNRKDKPFVAINCGALPESILESQLFGHVKGSFTGAHADTLGVFRAANGGVVFLDEITEMPLALQVRLLRVLQEREVTPVGSTEPVKIDVRVIAATNRPIEQAVKDGKMREDLYFRLSVVTLNIPALRERRDDVQMLVDFFNAKHAIAYGNTPPRYIDSGVRRVLQNYIWPGNVRELSNVIERCYALSDKPVIELSDLPEAIRNFAPEAATTPPPSMHMHVPAAYNAPTASFTAEAQPSAIPGHDAACGGRILFAKGELPTLDQVEEALIREALMRSGGRKMDVSRILDIERHRLYRKISKYNLENCWRKV